MDERPQGIGAVLVVRVWADPAGPAGAPGAAASEAGFRARITWTADVGRPGRSAVVTEPDEVIAMVRAWLTTCGHPPGGVQRGR